MGIKLRNRTVRHNKLRMSLRSNRKVGGDELMSQAFVDSMHRAMWQFMNLDTILYVLQSAGCSTKTSTQKNINDDRFKEHHKNTICFKGRR